jgi:mono/diheme cytochrome c family protein
LTKRSLSAALSLAALGAAVAFSAWAAPPPEPPGFKLKGDPKRGQPVYAKSCALCHGATGDGHGTLPLKPPPADLRAVTPKRSDWEVYVVIRDGGPALGLSKQMLGWSKLLTDQEIRDTAAFVRSLAPAKKK